MLTLLARFGYGYDTPQAHIIRVFHVLVALTSVAVFSAALLGRLAIPPVWGSVLIWAIVGITFDNLVAGHITARRRRQRLQKTVNQISEQVEILKGEADRLTASQANLRKNLGHF